MKKYKLNIEQDSNTDSPREWDNMGTMVCFHGRYNLGEKHTYDNLDYNGWDEMEKAIIKNEDVAVILPLFLYDHGGITISTSSFSCPWDSGQIGFIYISKKKVREEYGIKRITKEYLDKAKSCLEGEVKTYDQYLRGDVYGYEVIEVTTCELGHEHENIVESCWGFYGEDEARSEGESMMKYVEEHQTA